MILEKNSNFITEHGIYSFLKKESIIQKIIVLEEIDSTNRFAKELAWQGEAEGTLIIANVQNAGRGRMGRSFYSPAKQGIYMSIILRPHLSIEQSLRVTSCTAVAVARAIEKVSSLSAQIKWVNDVFVNGKKVCGILAEAGFSGDSIYLSHIVLGIGVNVGKMTFPVDLENIATSIENEIGKKISREQLLAEIWNEFSILYRELEKGTFLKECKERSLLLGKQIKVMVGTESYIARAVDLNEEGHLIVEQAGKRIALQSGEVSVRLQ